jgi:UDP-glucose 4-epimerase
MPKPKKVVVTGGAGFIGSHLVDRLLAEGHYVTVIDNMSTGRPENLAHIADRSRLKIEVLNICDLAKLTPIFLGQDYIFHLAALADIVPSIQNPLAYHQANVDGTIACLEAARAAKVKRFVYAASSSCYGLPDKFPTPETAEIRPMYPYALTKNIGEQMVMHWCKVYKLPAVSTRFFNVYGPRSRTSGTYGAVFGVFLAQKINGRPYTVVGDGTQTRDFTYVTDIADAVLRAAESNLVGEILNVGSGNTYSVNQLVSLLGGDIVYIPKRPGEPDCTFADITKIRTLLDWSPMVKFEDGVKAMLEHIDYWRNAPVWTSESVAEATKDWHQYLGG